MSRTYKDIYGEDISVEQLEEWLLHTYKEYRDYVAETTKFAPIVGVMIIVFALLAEVTDMNAVYVPILWGTLFIIGGFKERKRLKSIDNQIQYTKDILCVGSGNTSLQDTN